MAIVIGGHGLGLQDGSLGLLNRNDQTSNGTLDQRMQAFANVAGGNLVIQERDVFLPSRGDDFQLVRTYNSRGAIGGSADGWSHSTAVTLSTHQDKPANNGPSVNAYVVTYGDGSVAHFDFQADFQAGNRWVSTDGVGAYESLDVLPQIAADGTKFRLTRADQSQFNFDKDFVFISMVDTNGVRTTFTYQGGRVQTVTDDTGHVITYQYDGIGKLAGIVDELGTRLVSYTYSQSQLSTVTDRFGHVTTYSYGSNGLLTKISLPFQQTVNGQLQSFETREIQFTYQSINWDDHPHFVTPFDAGNQYALTSITDALGGVTTFENNFVFNTTAVQPGDRDLAYKQVGGRYFAGGTTRVVDATGNGLATSNAAEFQQKRVALGFAADVNALTPAQKEALRQQFSMSYAFDPDGYITQVTDQQGFRTTYTYGGKTAGEVQSAINQDNLLSMTDRNGWGATTSDSAYFRALRKDLGYIDAAGNGRLVANLSAADKTALLAKFTTTFTYDARGNLLTSTDGLGNQTSYTYTAFNKIASATSAMGNALSSLDDLTPGDSFYRNKRMELGLGIGNVAASSLTAAQKTALRTLYTTTYTYDAKQNLIAWVDPGGDRTEFQYDAFGNLSKRIVYLDASDLITPSKQQVTTYAYDVFGNNVSIVDGEGHTRTMTYDHFGNLLTMVDGRGGLTTFTYDADNRLLTTIDPEGHTTINTYDAVGNRISITDASGHTVTQVFDRNNLLITTIDLSATAALTRNTIFKYDIVGNRTEVTDAEGRKTTYSFDARRQLVDVATPQVLNGSEALVSYHRTYAYDGESNLVTSTDNNGNVSQALFTANGLLKRVTDPIGNVTEYLHDANLMHVQITIGAQMAPAFRRVNKFVRDEEDQLISQTDPLGKAMRMTYDAPGNAVSVTDANGGRTDFEYDRDDRLIKETKPVVTDPLTGQPVQYTIMHQYDANGNEVATTDQNGHVTTFTFDKDDRVVMITDANGVKTVYAWDARDNHTQVAIGVDAHLDAAGKVVIDSTAQAAVSSYVYDEFNQLVAATDAVGNALASSNQTLYQDMRAELGFARQLAGLSGADKADLLNRFTERYEYDRMGNRTKVTDHLGRISTMSYNALDRVQAHSEAVGTPTQRTTQLRYDGNGNLVKRTDSLGRVVRFSYDGNDRLVDETDPVGVVTHHTYDNVGNVLSMTSAFGTAQERTSNYVYDLNDRLTRAADPEGHVKQYEYDAVGNRLREIDTRGSVTQYVYDALNRNIKVIDPLTFETRFEYDGAGNRITLVDANGGIERMQYDGANRYIQTTDPEGRVTRFEYDRLDHVITQTTAFGSPEAQITRYVYDTEDNLRQVTDAAGKVSTQGFDAVYNLTRSTDANGHTTTTAFDALNRQIKMTDALGGVTTYSYDLEGNRLSETDQLGRTRSFAYDARDRMIRQTDALGVETTYAYDAVGNQVSITHAANKPEARTTTFVYDKDDRLVSQTDALGHTTTHTYNENDNIISTKDALNRVTRYTYDARNQVKSITDPLGHVTQFVYDGNGNRVQVIDARGNAQTMSYNRDNEMVLKVDAEGNVSTRSYDGNGNVAAITYFMKPLTGAVDPVVRPTPVASANDRTTRYEYDALNRMVKQIDAEGGVSTMTYDAVGNRLGYTDENGHTSHVTYDVLDRMETRTDPLGGERSYTYDAVGNMLSETDENGHTTTLTYDLENRLESETDPLGGTRSYVYDAVDNLLSHTDENGHTTTFTYDLADRMISETDPLLGVKRYGYDAVGNRTSIEDQNNAITRFEYDDDDRLVKRIDPLGGERSYTYDAVDNLLSETDENTHTTTHAYDKNDRRVKTTDPMNGERKSTYDAVGNQLSMTDENGHTTRFEYDRNDRLVKTIDPLDGERIFGYDAVGNRTSETDENGNTTTFFYDDKDRPERRVDALGGDRTYTYDKAGNQLSATDENDNTTIYDYDDNDRLIKLTDALGGERTYTYDAVGNRTSETDQVGALTEFEYDENDRLSKRTDALGGVREFHYDAVGNQTAMIDENGHSTTFIYDANRRIGLRTDALNHTRQFFYDAVGNQTRMVDENGHATEFAFDANDRLTKRTNARNGVTSFTYDAVGNQLTVTDENLKTTTYAYDELNRQVSRKDALNGVQLFGYDAAGNRGSEEDENHNVTTFDFDELNRMTVRTSALGYRQTFHYDARSNLVRTEESRSLTDPSDVAITRSAFDELNRLKSILSAEGYLTVYDYDAVGRRTGQTQFDTKMSPTATDGAPTTGTGSARVTKASYDANGRVETETDAVGVDTRYEYDGVGNRTAKIEADNDSAQARRSEIRYDAADRAIDFIDARGVVTHSVIDAAGNVTEVHEAYQTPAARVTKFKYDVLNRVEHQIDAMGFETEFKYDDVGNLLSRRSAIGRADERTESYEYDALNRQSAEVNGELDRTEYEYDGVGNRTRVTLAKGKPEERLNIMRYDADNRLIAEVDGNGIETQHRYDGIGNRIATIQFAAAYDANGNSLINYKGTPLAGNSRQTLFAYDRDNRLVSVVDPMGGQTHYEYDVLGNQTRIVDAAGHETINGFDAAGRLTSNLIVGVLNDGILVTNAYDAFGNVVDTRKSFADGSDMRRTTYAYDKLDRQTVITEYDRLDQWTASSVFGQAFSTEIGYDAFGNQTKLTYGLYLLKPGDAGYDAGKAVLAHPLAATVAYDELDRMSSTTDGVGNTIAYTNDSHGNRTSQTTGSGTPDARTVTFVYDKADRLVRRETGDGGVVKLTYDDAGNQTLKETLQSGVEGGLGADAPVWVRQEFSYDGNGRVVSEKDALGVVTEHELDAFGNEVATRLAAGTAHERVLRAEYNANNDLVAETDAMNGRSDYVVDALGNRIRETDPLGRVTYLYYNESNEQIATVDPENYLTTFGRDSAGNVVQTGVYMNRVSVPADGVTLPILPAGEVRVTALEFDGANNRVKETAADDAVTDYLYDSARKLLQVTKRGSSDADLLSRTADTAPRILTYTYDEAGRVRRFVNADGTVTEFTYDSANNKVSETVTGVSPLATGEDDPVRVTLFQYDAVNREISQTFDPDGLSLTQTVKYDKAGNIIEKTDAAGNKSTSRYDLGNRQIEGTDALGNVLTFGYDDFGNQTSFTDARGNTSEFEYDENDRLKKEILPAVDVFTIAGGLVANHRPTTERFYDAAGNLVQVVDPGGFKTTSYYDGNNDKIAEITTAPGRAAADGENVLRTFEYDATGALTKATLHMRLVSSSAHDPDVLPANPGGDERTVSTEYDAAGRLVKKVFGPPVEITTLSGVDAGQPVAVTQEQVTEEINRFDAFGNLVESIDKNGNRSLVYFDKLGRAVATVDAEGYLVETDFDGQGNLVRQRSYTQPLNVASLTSAQRPTPPVGDVAQIDRIYDAANRQVQELSAPVKVGEQQGIPVFERVLTQRTYDANGNQLTQTVAAGTPDEATEHYYYDELNRRIAVVTGGRTLNTFGYDANGNLTQQSRYIQRVPDALALDGITVDDLLAAVTPDLSQDETTVFSFDALNRTTQQSDLMAAGIDGDIVTSTAYDAVGNATQRTDAEGNVSQIAHDAQGHATQTLTPNGAASFIEYNAAGEKVRAWTGSLPNTSAQQATNVAASTGNGLTISWNQPGANSQSWVVWDVSAHDVSDLPNAAYPNETAHVGSGAQAVSIPLDGLTAGAQIYFRVVSQDAAGNIAWTEEKVATVPPGMDALAVARVGNDIVVRVHFTAPVADPQLQYGPSNGALNSVAAFAVQPDGSYIATIPNPSDPQALAFRVQWTAAGETITSAVIPLEADGEHSAVGATVGIPLPQVGGQLIGNGQLVLVDGLRNTTATRVVDQLQFDPQLTTNGTHRYDVFFGNLATADHSVKLTSVAEQSTEQDGADTIERDKDDNIVSITRHMNWVQDYHTNVEATLGAGEQVAGTVHAAVKAAGTGITFSDDVALSFSGGKYSGTLDLDPGEYDVKIFCVNAAGNEVIVEWRRITVSAAELPDPFDVIDDTDPFNFQGQEDELNLNETVEDPAGTRQFTGRSLEVLASETDGEIRRQGNSPLDVDAGLYLGPLDGEAGASPIQLTTSASNGAGALSTDGLKSQTYYTEVRYNTLGHKIATNEDSGVWRTLGVDANGNAVVTRTFGTQDDETKHQNGEPGHDPVPTYAVFDARDDKVISFDAATPVEGSAGLQHAVTRTSYDFARRVASALEPGDIDPSRFEYDSVGNLISQTDALGNETRRVYDRRGNLVMEIDPSGNVSTNAYDADNNVVAQTNAAGKTTTYVQDAFGRVVTRTDPLGHPTTMAYDQHDRLTTVTDALGSTSTRYYDKRDKEIWLQDANGNWFGSAYDPMGLLTHEYSFFHFSPQTLEEAQAALTPGNAFNDELIDVASQYDVFGNRITKTDANGRREFLTYGAFGRLTHRTVEDTNGSGQIALSAQTQYDRFGGVSEQNSSQGQDIVRSYDAVGRLTEVNDLGTGVRTTYSYHLNGERATEQVFAGGTLVRDMHYSYDANNRMVRWDEAVSGKHLNYAFDASGYLREVNTDDFSLMHIYTYTADGRIASFDKGQGLNTFTYDDAGNRVEWDEAGTIHIYSYDDVNRVIEETDAFGTQVQSWIYDDVGNIVQHVAPDGETTSNTYLANYLVSNLVAGTRTTATIYDKTGRTLSQTVSGDGGTTEFTFSYNADGTLDTVVGQGAGASGSSRSTYDANQRLVQIDLGQGDGQDRPEIKTFTYDNDGHILSRDHDDGRNFPTTDTEFIYALGNPVAEFDNQGQMVLDEGKYDPVKIISEDFPTTLAIDYVVRAGDTLQSIAAQFYGNPSLWFVIADANGLSGSERLQAGTHLKIPNTAQNGSITAETHALYQEGEIVGSKLPNLKTPPPPQTAQESSGGLSCAQITAIILTVVIAIVAIAATILTAGLFAPFAAGLIATTVGITSSVAITAITIGVVAVAGAVIGFAASALTQAVNIGFGLQKEFDWKQVAIDSVAGFVGGALAGIGQVATTAVKAAQLGVNLTRIARVALVVAEAAGEVAVEASQQAAANEGRIEQPWMLGVAVAGVAVGELLSKGVKLLGKAISKARNAGNVAAEAGASSGKKVRFADTDEIITSKPVSDVAVKPKDVATPLKAVDGTVTPSKSGSELSLKLTDPGAAFAANGRMHGSSMFKYVDVAASALSSVQGVSKLTKAPDFATLKAVNDLNVGNFAKYSKETALDYIAGSAGRIRNNKVPLPALPAPTAVTPKLELTAGAMAKVKLEPTELGRAKLLSQAAELKPAELHGATLHSLAAELRPAELGQAKLLSQSAKLEPTELGQAKPDAIVATTAMKADDGVVAKADDVAATPPPPVAQPVVNKPKGPSAAEIKANAERIKAERAALPKPSLIETRLDPDVPASSKEAKRAIQKYLQQSVKPWKKTPEGRLRQFAAMEKQLNKALADENVGHMAQDELELLQDTLKDVKIINTDVLHSPTHAMELKRLAFQPSLTARIGKFTDARLRGPTQMLGSGNLNTVYLAKYKRSGMTVERVFKPDEKGATAAAGATTGIDPDFPMAANRTLASTRLDDALGFGIITRSEMAIHKNKLGTVSELAPGVPIQGKDMLSNERVEDHLIKSFIDGFRDRKTGANKVNEANVVEWWNNVPDQTEQIAEKIVNGERHFYFMRHAYTDPNFSDVRLRRDLIRLQLMDAIAGQIDRHPGNYFVLRNARGEVVGVKAIDNDMAWGKLLRKLSERMEGSKLPRHLPSVVDAETRDAIKRLTPDILRKQLNDLLSADEIDAAVERLRLVHNHLDKLDTDKRVLKYVHEYASDRVDAWLIDRLNFKEGETNSYLQREMITFEKKRKEGVAIPYPMEKRVG